MSKTLLVSMNRTSFLELARDIRRACDYAVTEDGTPRDGAIEFELECEHNGPGPQLVIRFDNDDCEGPHIEDGQALWDWDDES